MSPPSLAPRVLVTAFFAVAGTGCPPRADMHLAMQTQAEPPTELALADYALVLHRARRGGDGVDYAALAADPAPLERFIRSMARVGPTSTPERFPTAADRTAYYLNAHNATVLHAVLMQCVGGRPPPRLRRDPRTATRFHIDGHWRTPLELRDFALRESGDDWRVRLALCGGRASDPPLSIRVFTGGSLAQQIEAQMRDALGSAAVIRVDVGEDMLLVSGEIYEVRERLIADYERRTGARRASLLAVLLAEAPHALWEELHTAVGFKVAPLPRSDKPNARNSAHDSGAMPARPAVGAG